MRVALVHDYLNQRGGAERVFAHVAQAYPEAPVYTALYDARATGDLIDGSRVRASYLNRIPGSSRFFRYLAPLYPRAFESFDFSGFDTIVSSTTAWAKGIRVPPGAIHVCYVNTVSRFIFAYDEYVGSGLARPIVRKLADWDRRAAMLPTRLIANSRNVADRIMRYYGRESTVLHCPVDLDRFTVGRREGNYFILASRLLPYKRIDVAIRAAQIAQVPLVVAGTGPDEKRLRSIAGDSPWIKMTGFISDRELNELLGNALAAMLWRGSMREHTIRPRCARMRRSFHRKSLSRSCTRSSTRRAKTRAGATGSSADARARLASRRRARSSAST